MLYHIRHYIQKKCIIIICLTSLPWCFWKKKEACPCPPVFFHEEIQTHQTKPFTCTLYSSLSPFWNDLRGSNKNSTEHREAHIKKKEIDKPLYFLHVIIHTARRRDRQTLYLTYSIIISSSIYFILKYKVFFCCLYTMLLFFCSITFIIYSSFRIH